MRDKQGYMRKMLFIFTVPFGIAVFVLQGSPQVSALPPTGRPLYVSNSATDAEPDDADVARFSLGVSGLLRPAATVPACGGARGLAITPDLRFAYVSCTYGQIWLYRVGPDGAFAVDPTSGRLTLLNIVDTGDNFVKGVAVTPDGRFVYVVSQVSDRAFGYQIGVDGRLTAVPGEPAPSGDFSESPDPAFQSVAILPNRSPVATLAVQAGADYPTGFDGTRSSNRDGAIARYDWDFGDGTTLPDGGATPQHTYAAPRTHRARLTPGGRFPYVSHGAQEATEVRGFEIGFDGTLTEIKQLDFGFDPVALAFGPDGRNLYVADFSGHTVTVFTVDALGNLAPVQTISSRGPNPGFQAVAVRPAQRPFTTVSHPEK